MSNSSESLYLSALLSRALLAKNTLTFRVINVRILFRKSFHFAPCQYRHPVYFLCWFAGQRVAEEFWNSFCMRWWLIYNLTQIFFEVTGDISNLWGVYCHVYPVEVDKCRCKSNFKRLMLCRIQSHKRGVLAIHFPLSSWEWVNFSYVLTWFLLCDKEKWDFYVLFDILSGRSQRCILE